MIPLSNEAVTTHSGACGRRCRICGHSDGNCSYTVREMQFGTREEFDYFQCSACGCLQIADIPDDLGRHYPPSYFSFRDYASLGRRRLRGFVATRRVRHILGGGSALGWLASLPSKPLDYARWMRKAGLGLDARVLDVGCGGAKLLVRMRLGGVRQVAGIDPFIAESFRYPIGVTVRKLDIQELAAAGSERYDLIMFHHSFEHMHPPLDVLRAAVSLLSERGAILVRLPVADCYAWSRYRESWKALDAPRHLYLHTRKSLASLAQQVRLEIVDVEWDATKYHLINSELYQRGIPGNASRKEKAIFSRRQLRAFELHTRQLNREGQGDQAAYLLKHAGG